MHYPISRVNHATIATKLRDEFEDEAPVFAFRVMDYLNELKQQDRTLHISDRTLDQLVKAGFVTQTQRGLYFAIDFPEKEA